MTHLSDEIVRKQLQEHIMAALMAPDAHRHTLIFEAYAEATSSGAFSDVTVRLPRVFEDVIVVSYRPHQTVASPSGPTAVAKF